MTGNMSSGRGEVVKMKACRLAESRKRAKAATRAALESFGRCVVESLESRTLLSADPPQAVLDLSGGFANNGDITLNNGAAISNSSLHLAGGSTLYYIDNVNSYRGSGPELSAFATSPRDVTQLTTSFDFQNNSAAPTTPGTFTFTIQGNSNTDPGGAGAHTVSFLFDLAAGDMYHFVNGLSENLLGFGSHTGLSFNNNDIYHVSFSYAVGTAGPGVQELITDTNTGATSITDINDRQLDIPAIVGGGAAFVGFTGGPNAPDILSWTYSSPAIGSTPFAPSYVLGTEGPHQITLNWTDNSSNEDGFEIEKSTDGFNFEPLANVSANVTTYTDAGLLTDPHSVFYRVRAFDSAGSSVASGTWDLNTPPPPPAPTNATASAISPNEVDLSWQDNTGLENPYHIYRRVGDSGDYALIASVHAGASNFTDTQAPSNSLLEYKVAACFDPGRGIVAESDAALASATTPSTPVDAFGPPLVFNGSAHLVGSALALTDNQAQAETGTAWSSNFQDISQFTTHFSFRFATADAGGFIFAMLDSNPAVLDGRTAVGDNAFLGFGTQFSVYHEIGVQFYLGNGAGAGGSTGLIATAPEPNDSVDVTSAGINFGSGHPFDATVQYARGIVNETITDAVTGATFAHTYWGILSAPHALNYVGFTGGKPANSRQSVSVNSWSYSSATQPGPATFIAPLHSAQLSLSASGAVGATATLTADLQTGGSLIAGATISFASAGGTPLGSATTDGNGVAF
jgi:hypothetical protein